MLGEVLGCACQICGLLCATTRASVQLHHSLSLCLHVPTSCVSYALRCPQDGLARAGRWLNTALVQNYCSGLPPHVLLACAGFPQSTEPLSTQFWHSRFNIDIDAKTLEELKLVLMPFLPKFRESVAEVIEGGWGIRHGGENRTCFLHASWHVAHALAI